MIKNKAFVISLLFAVFILASCEQEPEIIKTESASFGEYSLVYVTSNPIGWESGTLTNIVDSDANTVYGITGKTSDKTVGADCSWTVTFPERFITTVTFDFLIESIGYKSLPNHMEFHFYYLGVDNVWNELSSSYYPYHSGGTWTGSPTVKVEKTIRAVKLSTSTTANMNRQHPSDVSIRNFCREITITP
jgi:hypothetical protein